ncbi:hypothetical protein NEUTE1DRAFT_112443 [Neurospora tetrasperma FGSC 2508]|uniref:Uncharacterized protein n=1 Tax=Neurospora tetrasperma (strain FGSC 2508 / ATCC MYA-4615 / P0657) TaxID=510951 RepID=F8MT03_NEUT8|nr:uncharacterized protein NEUTE1DRAFT_112443 [Neurospora tetrasperma FGSC 2508]EGO55985.1 hypothetical protein NEUTE1DRAFT_112443 [Neurospora tetrasperma FGSC 2508]
MSGLPQQELSKEWTLAAWNLVPLSVGVAVKIGDKGEADHVKKIIFKEVYKRRGEISLRRLARRKANREANCKVRKIEIKGKLVRQIRFISELILLKLLLLKLMLPYFEFLKLNSKLDLVPLKRRDRFTFKFQKALFQIFKKKNKIQIGEESLNQLNKNS